MPTIVDFVKVKVVITDSYNTKILGKLKFGSNKNSNHKRKEIPIKLWKLRKYENSKINSIRSSSFTDWVALFLVSIDLRKTLYFCDICTSSVAGILYLYNSLTFFSNRFPHFCHQCLYYEFPYFHILV